MGLADIQKKQSEERQREKRLVHFTNAVSRDFQTSKIFKTKTKTYKDNADYVVKSFLDYVFFNEHKEIRELNDTLIKHFMVEFAPKKLTFTPEAAEDASEILSKFLVFLDGEGHIHNGGELSSVVKKNNRTFLKLLPKTKRKTTKKTDKKITVSKKTSDKKKSGKKAIPEVKVGRNDPCPCGSGKKYKKCCGRNK
ncbi:MAG: SEC-C metal-binding domain-containing protein [bacterium]